MDLGDAVGWVLVEHHRDVPRVLAPTHVLLVRALKWIQTRKPFKLQTVNVRCGISKTEL